MKEEENSGLIENQYQQLLKEHPELRLVEDHKYHVQIPIINNRSIDINFKNYPKRPKVYLIDSEGNKFKKLDMMLDSLKEWEKNDPLEISILLSELLILIDGMASNDILIKQHLINGLLQLCKDKHPERVVGLLRKQSGIISEYVMPPRKLCNVKTGLAMPFASPVDQSYDATFLSHPGGKARLSDIERELINSKRFHMIIVPPYTDLNCVKCFNVEAEELKFQIVE